MTNGLSRWSNIEVAFFVVPSLVYSSCIEVVKVIIWLQFNNLLEAKELHSGCISLLYDSTGYPLTNKDRGEVYPAIKLETCCV